MVRSTPEHTLLNFFTMRRVVRSIFLRTNKLFYNILEVKPKSLKSLSPQQATGHYMISPFGTDFV